MPRPPDIVVIVLDAARAASVSAYGYDRPTTPHLDAFAADNVLFRHAIAPATWTVPTHASLLTGLYLSEHRIESIAADRRLHPAVVPLPQALRGAGYRTAAFSLNMLFSPAHHFDWFDDFFTTPTLLRRTAVGRIGHRLAQHGRRRRLLGRYLRKRSASAATLAAVADWLEQPGARPGLAVVNLTDVHYPWAPPLRDIVRFAGRQAPLARRGVFNNLNPYAFNSGLLALEPVHRQMWRALYDATLAHVDRLFGRFLHHLQRRPVWRNLVLAVTADHGELLGEPDGLVGGAGLVGHMLSLSDRLLHVPLIVRHPDYAPGTTVDTVVQTHDLPATAVAWAGAPAAALPAAQRRRPTWDAALTATGGGSAESTPPAFAEEDYTDSYDVPAGLRNANPAFDVARIPRRQEAVRTARYKLIVADDRPARLYDIARDPHETVDLAADAAAAAQDARRELTDALTRWRAERVFFPPQPVAAAPVDDPELVRRLRELGYLP